MSPQIPNEVEIDTNSTTSEKPESVHSDLSTHDPYSDRRLIQTWSTLKPLLLKSTAQKQSNDQPLVDKPQVTPTISHGFQQVRTMEHQANSIISVLHVPNYSLFLALEKEYLHLWRGGIRFQKIPVLSLKPNSLKKTKAAAPVDGLYNISQWMYLEDLHLYIVMDRQLALKILDLQYLTLFSLKCQKRILRYAGFNIVVSIQQSFKC
jgi:hypothetical protein